MIWMMLIPHPKGGELAKRFRKVEEDMGHQTGFKIKIVEKTGTRIEDLLHKSNPWQ